MLVNVISGGFDPLHAGHLDLIEAASNDSDTLIVLLNNDEWLIRKKGYICQSFEDRKRILQTQPQINRIFEAQTDEQGTVIPSLEKLFTSEHIRFVNDGDRDNTNTPELEFCERVGMPVRFLGNPKVASSSQQYPVWVERPWGRWTVLSDHSYVKTKLIEIDTGRSISFQVHEHRNELWSILQGRAQARTGFQTNIAGVGEHVLVEHKVPHKITNIGDTKLVLHEVQFGDSCTEDDIVRLHDPEA